MSPDTQRAVRFHTYGGPEVLRLDTVPVPQPGPGEIRVRVEAAGVNFADTMRRRGAYVEPTPLPYTPGLEVGGTVEAVGEGVTVPVVGARVVAFAPHGGGYAEHAVVPAAFAIPLPPGVDPAAATALLVQGLTAHFLLADAARLQPGESVLVHAAAGGVGSLAVQLARRMGAGLVIATASTAAKLAVARDLGADAGVDYTRDGWPDRVREATDGRGVDAVLEMVGGEVFARSFECLAPFGRLVTYGSAGGASRLDGERLLVPNHRVVGFYLGGYLSRPALLHEAFGALFRAVADGGLRVRVANTFALADASDAHRAIEARATTGKVVLRP